MKVSSSNIQSIFRKAIKTLQQSKPQKDWCAVVHPFTHFRIMRPEVFFYAEKFLNRKYYIHFRSKQNKIGDKRTAGGKFVQLRFLEFIKHNS